MRYFLAVLAVLGACFSVRAQTATAGSTPAAPLLIGGWNRFSSSADATWWEKNAVRYDEMKFDCVLHVLEVINFEVMDRVIAEDKKRNFQIIVTVDGARNVVDVLKFFDRYKGARNARGLPLIHSAVVGWDKVNNIHPDDDFSLLAVEMTAAANAARIVDPALPVWLCVSYTPGAGLDEWMAAMKDVPRSGVWLWNVWGWEADTSGPMAAMRARGETNVVLGGVYGFKYFEASYRADLIARSAAAIPGFWRSARAAGYSGVSFLSNFDPSAQFGGTRFLNEAGAPNEIYDAFKALK